MSAATHTAPSRRRRERPPDSAPGVRGLRPPRRPASATRDRRGQVSSLPFLGLIAGLLAGGLLTLLIVNNTLAAGSFEQAHLKADQILLSEQEQALRQEVQRLSSPTRLRAEAKGLGLVPAASTAYLDIASGQILGTPIPAGGGSAAVGMDPAPGPVPLTDGITDGTATDAGTSPTAGGDAASTASPDAQPEGADGAELPGAEGNDATGRDGGTGQSPATAYDRAIVSGGGR